MKEMTEEEADYWDGYYTKNTIMPEPSAEAAGRGSPPDLSKPGYFSRKYGMAVKLDPETTRTLAAQAEAIHQTPAEIIANLVREKFAGTGEPATVP